MGTSHSVHMANASGQNISIFVGLNPRWSLLDFFLDVTLMALGANEIRGLALAAADFNFPVPGKLETLRDLFDFATIAQIMLTRRSADTRMLSAAEGFFAAIRQAAISITHGTYQNINQRNVLQIYLNPSGYAGILGAQTVTVFVMSADGKQVALYNTGPDHSWIATSQQSIVRSRYGTIWQQDPGAGSHAWGLVQLGGPDSIDGLWPPQVEFHDGPVTPRAPPPEYAVEDGDGNVDVMDGAADAMGSNVDVANGAMSGIDGKVDVVGDVADGVDGKVGLADGAANTLDEVDSDVADGMLVDGRVPVTVADQS